MKARFEILRASMESLMNHRVTLYGCAAVTVFCIISLSAAAQGPAHPDLTGMWNGGPPRGLTVSPDDPFGAYLPAREGTLLNFERDNTIIRRMDPNKPLYKPQFWQKVQQFDQNGNNADPSFGCMPAGVPRMGNALGARGQAVRQDAEIDHLAATTPMAGIA